MRGAGMAGRDLVTPAVRAYVLLRDKRCFLAKIEEGHLCRDRWGRQHDSDDLERLTLDHVKDGPMMGRRAPSDPAHLVALCYSENVRGPSKVTRAAERSYLHEINDGKEKP